VNCPACRAENDEAAEICRKCGKGLYALTDGSVLAGRYEIVQPLGKGGMGLVYKARDRELKEVVAVKVLRSERTEELARRFVAEIRFARKVRHPNVCAIHEYGQDGHLRFIIMEFVEGLDLKQLIRRQGPFPPLEALETATQVAAGLSAVHAAGIVHRDLKTTNIMRDSKGVIRLMDFGIAKQYDSDSASGATATGQILGTPEYMSPEQARGEKVDARSDIYALGVVLYELFTGEVPFRGDTPIATLMKHIQEPPDLTGPKARRIPNIARPVLACALEKHRERRYRDASAMLLGLRDALHGFKPGRVETNSTLVGASAESGATLSSEDASTLGDGGAPTVADADGAPTADAATVPRRRLPTGNTPRPITPRAPATVPRAPGPAKKSGLAIAVAIGLALVAGVAVWLARPHWPIEPGSGPEVAATVPVSSQPEPSPSVVASREPSASAAQTGPLTGPSTTAPTPAQLTAPSLVGLADQQLPVGAAAMPRTDLRWRPVAGAVGYRLTLDADRTFSKPLLARTTRITSVAISGLEPRTYYWRVVALGEGGAEGRPSEVSSFVVRPAVATAATLPSPTTAPEVARGRAEAEGVELPTGTSSALSPTTLPPTLPSAVPSAVPSAAPSTQPLPRVPTANPQPAGESAVRQALEAYKAAFASLDPKAIKRVYPSISKSELEGFRTFKGYELELDNVRIDLKGFRAQVQCTKRATFRTFTGKDFKIGPLEESLTLELRNGAWVRVE